LHVDDCADGLVHVLQHYSADGPINLGAGADISILELARLVCEVVGFEGEIALDRSKPDGTPSRLMDAKTISALGWKPKISLRDGIANAYAWFRTHGSRKAA
jgi:GDP-L-fucose synthase